MESRQVVARHKNILCTHEDDSVCVPGRGSTKSRVMLVGEAPGANEAKKGKPFVGRAGQVLNAALANGGLSRESVYVTNVVKCRPPNNDTPTDEQIDAYMPYLWDEIREVDPTHILLLGGTAYYAFTGWRAVSKGRGDPFGLYSLPDVTVFATYHPAATFYSKDVVRDFYNDVKSFAHLVNGSTQRFPVATL